MTYRPWLFPIVFTTAGLSLRADNLPAVTAPPDNGLSPVSASTVPAMNGAPVPAAGPSTPTTGNATAKSVTHTVVAGDTLSSIGLKYHCSVHALKKANKLTSTHLKAGQVLKIPSTKTAKTKTAPVTTAKVKSTSHKDKVAKTALPKKTTPVSGSYLVAQPVQDFDSVPASDFASCPVPAPGGSDEAASPASEKSQPTETSAPVPAAVEPEGIASDAPEAAPISPAIPRAKPVKPASVPALAQASALPAPGPAPAPSVARHSNFFQNLFSSHAAEASASGEWGNRFLTTSQQLADRGIGYDESWRPEGESHAWAMDCSNTSRYLYKVTAGIELPRTASDQYYYLHLQGKAWDVPMTSRGYADCDYLRANLRPGDLLFWENTYRPERQPPITHVMIFLGSNERGEWIMSGSQSSRGGAHNRRRGGPDIYVFDPTKACGGYTTWLGLVHHQGRFCAYGRPLDADPTKLSVAANN